MNLRCDIHRCNHHFTPSAVERIVYALQAKLIKAALTGTPGAKQPISFCPEQVLREAGDSDGFRAYVDARRDDRLRADKTRQHRARMRRREG